MGLTRGRRRPSERHKSSVPRAKTAAVSRLSGSEKGRSSFVGVAGLAGLFLSPLCLHYLTSSPCLPTVTLMEPEGAGMAQNLLEKHQPHLIVFEQRQRLCQECTAHQGKCIHILLMPLKRRLKAKEQNES